MAIFLTFDKIIDVEVSRYHLGAHIEVRCLFHSFLVQFTILSFTILVRVGVNIIVHVFTLRYLTSQHLGIQIVQAVCDSLQAVQYFDLSDIRTDPLPHLIELLREKAPIRII